MINELLEKKQRKSKPGRPSFVEADNFGADDESPKSSHSKEEAANDADDFATEIKKVEDGEYVDQKICDVRETHLQKSLQQILQETQEEQSTRLTTATRNQCKNLSGLHSQTETSFKLKRNSINNIHDTSLLNRNNLSRMGSPLGFTPM